MRKRFEKVITGRIVVDADQVLEDGFLAIQGGKVACLGDRAEAPEAEEVIEAGRQLVLPGVVDIHVHCLDDLSEGYGNASRAAAAGGTTTIVDHPIDVGGAPVTAADIERKRRLAEAESLVDAAFLAGVTPASLAAVADPVRAGIVGYKALMHRTAPEKMRELNDGELLEAFERIQATGLFVGVHAENDSIVAHRIARLREQNRTDLRAHIESRPPVSETEAVHRAVALAASTGVRLHVFHVSLPEGIDIADRAKRRHPGITCETCPQYLVLDEEDFLRIGARAKINPPLRKGVRDGLWERLRKGMIDIVSSDHAPQDASRKNHADIFANSSGTPGAETLLTLLFSEGVARRRIPLGRLVEVLCRNPARLIGLYPAKGCLHIGSDADLVLLDPDVRWTIRGSELHYFVGWTAYEGLEAQGRPTLTMVRGRVIYRNGEYLAAPGEAKALSPARRAASAAR